MLNNKRFAVLILLLTLFNLCFGQKNLLIMIHENLTGSNSLLSEYVAIKQDMGFDVFIETVSDGDDFNSLKATLEGFSPVPDYVLFIGDAFEFPEASRTIVSFDNKNLIPFNYSYMYLDCGLLYHEWGYVANDEDYFENLPDVKYGRIPAESIEELNNWIEKYLEYVNYTTFSGWKNAVLMLTGDMNHPSNGGRGAIIDTCTDFIVNKYLNTSGLRVERLNSKDFNDPYGFSWQRSEAFEEAVNGGIAVINANGVGADPAFLVNFYWTEPYPMSSWSFSNKGKYPVLFGMSCSIGEIQKAYDVNGEMVKYPSNLEKLLFYPDGGIIGAIATTTISHSYTINCFNDTLWYLITQKDRHILGDIYKTAKDMMEIIPPKKRWREDYLWENKATHLFGDPSMPLALYQHKTNDITESTEWSGSIIIERPLTIAPGTTLRIRPSTGIFFKPGASLIVKGDFIAEGTEDFPIVLAAATEEPQHGFWQGLVIAPDENPENEISLNHVEIRDAVNGLRLYRESGQVTISNSRIHDNSASGILFEECNGNITLAGNEIDHNGGNGLEITHSRSISLQGNSIHHNSYSGVLAYRESVVDMRGNRIYNNGTSDSDPRHCGIYSSAGSVVFLLMNGSDEGVIENCESNNWIYDNSCCGVLADEGSYPELGIYDEDFAYIYGGLNRIYGQPVDVWNANRSGKIYAQVNYWQWDKFSPCEGSSPAHIEGEVIWDPAMPLPEIGETPEGLLLSGLRSERSGDYATAYGYYETLVNSLPDSPEVVPALSGMVRCLESEGNETGIETVMNAIIEEHPHTRAGRYALDQIMIRKTEVQHYSQALTLGDTLQEIFAGTGREGLYLYEEGRIYEQMYRDGGLGKYSRLAMRCYEQAYREFPGSVGGYLSALRLGREVTNPYTMSRIEIPDSYRLYPVYPNPFNPEVTIPIALPEESRVRVDIYNLLGERVRTVVNSRLSAGMRQVIWDGRDDRGRKVASGVYLIHFQVTSLETGNVYNQRMKCVLMR